MPAIQTQKVIKIKLKSYDHRLVDIACERIVKSVEPTGAEIKGPIPLPNKTTIFTVLRSPHVHKKSREQFKQVIHKRIIYIYYFSDKTLEIMKKIELPSGVYVEVKQEVL